jgi:hypothetical protein
MQRMAEVNAYNAAHADAEFDGVVLDVEPPEPQSTADFQNLLALYQCVRSNLPQRGGDRLGLAVAIRFFWDAVAAFPGAVRGRRCTSTSSTWNWITSLLWSIAIAREQRARGRIPTASSAWTSKRWRMPIAWRKTT